MPDPELILADVPEERRYEARLDGELAGVLEYRDVSARRILAHTEVLPEFEGRGIGGALARHALEDARTAHRRVSVKCPFVRSWLERHRDYAHLVTELPARGA